MELNIFDVIKGTISTTKSLEQRRTLGKITFLVNNAANKILVRDAVKKIWKVEVDTVRIINLHGKNKTSGRRSFVSSDVKKAIVTLKKGYKIDLGDQFETMGLKKEENLSKGKE
ncbi:TPA: 50S ribosomal protein L23 [Candidatus Dependentiae bacterium]|nr:MAG: 50S ribosomal protein L23 [candidate division TM6 bacterium GW2011_GWE2_31_21]KKP53125.1 MAG: 50S ribosomal protein L23 [candidate division TM6 bacterium GW2011_GWF2_33_332]HBS47944.1 50S ribosomal protein L23 [Candidatus Dependentiae bacterium]HBZ73452.1 50S ribosomal protein L23 [Candidatus Dependentiae bacterium]